jgi:Family of unknown function (DUF6599)
MIRQLMLPALVLAIGLSACGGSQPGSTPPSGAVAPASAAVADTGLAAYLPASGALAGWTRSKPPQAYTADNLWEFIDGAAETYVAFGFQDALGAGYTFGGADVSIEIYQMSDSLHAFGIYTQERPPAPQPAPVGTDGYTNSNVLVFWKGPCYVKLIANRPDQPGSAALAALAGAISGKLPGGAPLPPELSAFPQKSLVAHSIKLVPKDVLGQSYFANGFEAGYQDGPAASRLVVIPFAAATDATAGLDRYRAFVGHGGKTRTPSPRVGDEAFAADDRYNGRVVAVRSGPTLVISVGAASDAAGSALIADYLRARRLDSR